MQLFTRPLINVCRQLGANSDTEKKKPVKVSTCRRCIMVCQPCPCPCPCLYAMVMSCAPSLPSQAEEDDVEIEYVSAPLDLPDSEPAADDAMEEEHMGLGGLGLGLGLGMPEPKKVCRHGCMHGSM